MDIEFAKSRWHRRALKANICDPGLAIQIISTTRIAPISTWRRLVLSVWWYSRLMPLHIDKAFVIIYTLSS